jgi:sulfatase modifying factor 1
MFETRERDATGDAVVLVSKIATMLVIIAFSNVGCTHMISRRIQVYELESKSYEVIGHLGVPLGWTVRAEAVVVDGDSLKRKEYLGQYLLNIDSINGKKIKKPLLMDFSDRTRLIPNDQFKRYEYVEGHPTGGLNSEIKARINKGYVGNRYDLLIYEDGVFSGFISPEHPIHFMVGQGNIRCLQTSVCILQVYGVNEGIRALRSYKPVSMPSVMVAIPLGRNSGVDPDFGEYSLTNAVAFCMDSTEVTKAKWEEVYTWALKHGYSFDNAGYGKTSNHPVNMINWYDCVKWCNARSENEGKVPCYMVKGDVYRVGKGLPDCNFSANGYRLPTKKEWEFAARGGLSGKRFPWGDTITHRQANYYSDRHRYDVSLTEGFHPDFYEEMDNMDYSSPVGSFAANGYGLFDMAGNLKEWCGDYTSDFTPYVKGGCWVDPAEYARCGETELGDKGEAYEYYGFRSVCR